MRGGEARAAADPLARRSPAAQVKQTVAARRVAVAVRAEAVEESSRRVMLSGLIAGALPGRAAWRPRARGVPRRRAIGAREPPGGLRPRRLAQRALLQAAALSRAGRPASRAGCRCRARAARAAARCAPRAAAAQPMRPRTP